MRSSFFVFLALACLMACSPKASSALATSPPVAVPSERAPKADSLTVVTDLADAKRLAKKYDTEILMVFAGSDWCRPCKQFRMGVLEDAGFGQNLKQELVVLYLDFPSKRRNQLPPAQKAANEQLAEKYNVEGLFPRIYVIDRKEEVLGELSYSGEDASAFEASLRTVLSKRG